ncbi:hypothetical protein EPA93_04680 [Ktedonosporobacter rubrisoli]|uniref:Zinc finger CGNR domain-containing protein n=1 Tax=Ktedonosporobacter rubrisoli TaxID=2509675 RepID=A0A4P6JK40_KTERU|nr:ABATE domain-containing protein [Ktedonosporobacter rubrisoli]QBD75330.1 hypothetical protein EPA93_04680 [Ktedonosporobacter rubrisoli]
MVQYSDIHAFEMKRGQLCLDFMNTVGWRPSSHAEERLTCYADLLHLGKQAAIFTDEQQSKLLSQAQQQPETSGHLYQRALQLREALYRLFLSVIKGEERDSADLALLNREYATMQAQLRVIATERGFALRWPEEGHALESVFWHIAKSAVDIFTSDILESVRLCAAPDCGWLFFDQSKNRSRKWCDSQVCGNRERVRKYYRQSRSLQVSASTELSNLA